MPTGHYRFRRSLGNVSSKFRGARPDTYPLTDPDIAAFAAESGATDLSGLTNLVEYLKAESLYDNFVIYPMKSAQNAGSGSTLYSLGGLTANNATLINSPTWTSGGLTLNGTNQCGRISDFLGGDLDLAVFARGNFTLDTTGVDTYIAQYDTYLNQRSFQLNQNGNITSDGYSINRSTNGTGANVDALQNQVAPSTGSDNCIVAHWPQSSTGAGLWLNKTSRSLTAVLPEVTSKFNATIDVTIGARLNSGTPDFFAAGTYIAAALCEGVALTTTQREAITDYINAL